jgi:3-methyladenine DNA glycosylase/8-oxoguanine DNA glycosylase
MQIRMNPTKSWSGARISTIGHSTRTVHQLIELLRAAQVRVLVDIRTMARSRHNPQFNGAPLRSALRRHGLLYEHLAALGGLRRGRKDSPNTGWRNTSFRGYADYMLTADFESGLAQLRALTAQGTVALMCAEAVPWRCHRSLVADALTARGAHVEHIIGSSHPSPHRLTAFARVSGGRVTYPGQSTGGTRLAVQAPFHLEATVRVLQRRPANRIDVWEPNHYLRVLTTADGLVLVEVENLGTIDDPDLRLSIRSGNPSAATQLKLARTVRKVLGLDVSPAPLQRRMAAERRLRPIALALRGMRPPRFAGLFEAFANVIPFQQMSVDAGVAIVGKLAERFGKHVELGKHRFNAFPTSRAVAGARLATLQKCGLSKAKAESLRHVAKAVESGNLTEDAIADMSTPDALARLTELPGIGAWSAALVLLRGFGRIDVFPPGDVGAAQALSELLRLHSREALDRIVERFGEHRGYFYFFGLAGSLMEKDLIHGASQ